MTSLKKRKSLVGTEVYIPSLDKRGTVISQDENGNIVEVKVGEKIVNVLEDIVEIIPTIIGLLRGLFRLLGI